MQIKIPKTQKTFRERERPVVRSTCSSWFGVSEGGENTIFRNIEAREGMCDCC